MFRIGSTNWQRAILGRNFVNKFAALQIYLGKQPDHVDYFIKSIAKNKHIDWFLLYDDEEIVDEYTNMYENIHIFHYTQLLFLNLVFEKLNIRVDGFKPYKLCDYKLIYGYLFEDLFENYSYWGFFDSDLIFGDLSFLSDENVKIYDRIFDKGHLSFFKNIEKNRFWFKKFDYLKILSSKHNYGFDERSDVVNHPDLLCLHTNNILDIKRPYETKKFEGYNILNYPNQKILYNCGKIQRVYLSNVDEFYYIHFQKRKMPVENVTSFEKYLITPIGLFDFDLSDSEIFDMYRKNPFSVSERYKMLIKDYLKIFMRKFF